MKLATPEYEIFHDYGSFSVTISNLDSNNSEISVTRLKNNILNYLPTTKFNDIDLYIKERDQLNHRHPKNRGKLRKVHASTPPIRSHRKAGIFFLFR